MKVPYLSFRFIGNLESRLSRKSDADNDFYVMQFHSLFYYTEVYELTLYRDFDFICLFI
jgi:hypothetical protein